MADADYSVPIDAAIARLSDGDDIHTFRSTPLALFGADWCRDQVIDAMKKFGVSEAGDQAASMGHTLVVIDDNGPLFIEAEPSQ